MKKDVHPKPGAKYELDDQGRVRERNEARDAIEQAAKPKPGVPPRDEPRRSGQVSFSAIKVEMPTATGFRAS